MKPEADILLTLEGTYPYIRGGVSSWVHQIITGLPDYTFSLLFLGGSEDQYGEIQYELPDNVVHMEVHYMMQSWQGLEPKPVEGNREAFDTQRSFHDYFHNPELNMPDELMNQALNDLGDETKISREDFLFSRSSWDMISDSYEKYCTEPSYIDYFWTVRTIHAPLFQLAEIVKSAPPAKVVHSVSTGYAGLLAAMLARRFELPYILTEHGIYTKERKIDLAQASWISEQKEGLSNSLHAEMGYMRRMWIKFFEEIGKLSYQAADPIIALYEGNRQRQVRDGAEADRTMVIPNGIPLDHYADALNQRPADTPLVMGLIGRVVPIKDIKTYIRTMRIVCNQIPEAEGWIIGPEDEDPDYVTECRNLVASLGLEEQVKFLGFQKIPEILPKMGIMVLTSISEAMPLVILEGYAAGVPCIATDVGSCRELIEGQNEEDCAIGAAGTVVPIADPNATANAAIELLNDPEKWQAASKAGYQRLMTYYTQPMMFDAYNNLYRDALNRNKKDGHKVDSNKNDNNTKGTPDKSGDT